MGINLQSFCQETDLENFSSLEQIAALIITGILFGYQQYLKLGAATILNNYQKLLNSLGRKINLDGTIGIVTGVTAAGQLQVNLENSGKKIRDVISLSPGQISLGYD